MAFYVIWCLVILTARADQPPEQGLPARIRQYAQNFRLPDIAWDQVLTIYEAGPPRGAFHKEAVSYTSRLAHDDIEYWRAARANGKPAGGSAWREARKTNNLLRAIAAEMTTLIWDRWEPLNGQLTAVFRYSVERRDSDWTLAENGAPSVTLPHSGFVWAEPRSGIILRISDEVVDIPSQFQMRSVTAVIDYASVPIGVNMYVLPIKMTEEILHRDHVAYRDEWAFLRYRRFAADSSIVYEQ